MRPLNILFWRSFLIGVCVILFRTLLVPFYDFIGGAFIGYGLAFMLIPLFYKVIWRF